MICVFCSAHLDDKDEAKEAGWWPDFYAREVNYEGPVCPSCTSKFLFLADCGEMELQPGVEVPPLAIPLNRHPNMKKMEFPQTIEHEGKLYRRTGKVGVRFADGIKVAEYEATDASRIWLGVDGQIALD